MNARSELIGHVQPFLGHYPGLKNLAERADLKVARLRYRTATVVPSVTRLRPHERTVAVTACRNLRCVGWRYGRHVMPGTRLSPGVVRDAITDAKASDVDTVRLCNIALPLGDVNQIRLRDILLGPEHKGAAQDAFKLNRSNSRCFVDIRIQKHRPSVHRHRDLLPGERAHA